MFFEGCNPNHDIEDVNAELLKIQGDIEDDRFAKITLAKFLRYNLRFTFDLLTGGEFNLYPFQEILLRAWFNKTNSLNVISRGGSKSTAVAVFACLYPIFEPDSQIVIVSSNFRNARDIFAKIDKWTKSRNAFLLRQCFAKNHVRRNDLYEVFIGNSVVKFVPSSGENLRGLRASVLIVDELRLVGEETLENVLKPLLAAPHDITKRQKIRELETQLIKQGRMKEEDRMVFANTNKFIGLSSASFQFEHLFKLFCKYEEIITKDLNNSRDHFISQIGFDSIPRDMVDKSILDAADAGATADPVFMREYGARFIDDSMGYFSAKAMNECTLPNGQTPTIQIKGEPGAEYILSIDPSYSAEKNSDDFAMGLIKINRENKTGTLVHNYALAGGDILDHIKYLHYLITYFNIVYIIIDSTGHGENFMNAANESVLFKSSNIELKSFDCEFDKKDYVNSLRRAKYSYNLSKRVIVDSLIFDAKNKHEMNEHLVYCITFKKIWFASKAAAYGVVFEAMSKTQLPLKWEDENYNILEFIRDQDDLIDETKKQTSLIVPKVNPSTGVMSFDLPNHLKKLTGNDRPRKDLHSALLMGAFALKRYWELQDLNEIGMSTFTPFLS